MIEETEKKENPQVMSPYCPDHTKLVQDVGEIKGIVTVVREDQQEAYKTIFQKLDGLATNGSRAHEIAAVEREKIKPLYWFLASVGSAVILVAVDLIVRHYWIATQVIDTAKR